MDGNGTAPLCSTSPMGNTCPAGFTWLQGPNGVKEKPFHAYSEACFTESVIFIYKSMQADLLTFLLLVHSISHLKHHFFIAVLATRTQILFLIQKHTRL